MPLNHRILLASRPTGAATAANFRLDVLETPPLAEGEVLVRHEWLSLDPYMRRRMDAGRSYSPPQPLGQVMVGGTAGVVVASRHSDYREGEAVVGYGGWQEYSVFRGDAPGRTRKVDTSRVPLSHYLGAAGMPGVTAWVGLVHLIEAKAGETIVVSAASGAVGSAVGALAKARECRVVGIAGGPDKCAYVVDELGYDACVDYKEHAGLDALARALQAACPAGIDGIFENVGGTVLDAALLGTNDFARVAVCGMIAGYDGTAVPLRGAMLILARRLRLQGFIQSEFPQCTAPARAELAELVGSGRLRPRESVAHGLASAPEAFLGMLQGRNFGKQLVKLT